MRVSENHLNSFLEKQIIESLAQTLVDIKDLKEARQFLVDFLSEPELQGLSKRLAVAYWLKKKRSYGNIKQNLKVSSATIASVQQTMDKPGMVRAIKNLEAEEWANVWTEKIQKFVKNR